MNKKASELKCEKCEGVMKKKRQASHSGASVILLILGIILLFLFPIGTIFGILFLLMGFHYGSKAKGLWVCQNCGYQFERKIRWFEFG